MGCCCRKSRELKELEAELERLLCQKRSLDSKPLATEKTSEDSQFLLPDIFQFIDHDQYTSLKIIENLFSLLSGDIQIYQSLSHKIQNLSNLKHSERLIDYGNIRLEETNLQDQMVGFIKDQFKEIVEFFNFKYNEIEERIEKVQNLFGSNNDEMIEERENIVEGLKGVRDKGKIDLQGVVKGLKELDRIEKVLIRVESGLLALIKDDFFVLRLKEMEKELAEVVKSSLASVNSIKSVFGEATNTSENSILKSSELNELTFTTLLTSLTQYFKLLQDLETQKLQLINSNDSINQLNSIEKSLTKYLLNSDQLKSITQSRLNRVSRSSSEFSQLHQALFLKLDIGQKSIPGSIKILQKKFSDFLKSLEQQDHLLLEMTEKFNTIDKTVDEIELKFHEFLSSEIKDLYKNISNSEIEKKSELDEINEKLIQYTGETQKDLVQRLEFLLSKVLVTEEIEKIKLFTREIHSKELTRIKSELQDKVFNLTSNVDSLTNEKLLILNSFEATKSQLSITSEMTEDLMKTLNDKDLTLTSLKNSIASLKEQLGQISSDKTKLEDEVEDTRKELRECKKALRSKEHELSELQELISNPPT